MKNSLPPHTQLTNTKDGAGWLKLEFDQTYLVHKVVIYHRFFTNWYNPDNVIAKSEANFKTTINKGNNVDVSVYQGDVKQKSCGILHLTYGLKHSDQIYTLLCNVEGDTVKLSKNEENYILVNEIAVISKSKKTSISCFLSIVCIAYGQTLFSWPKIGQPKNKQDDMPD